MPVDEAGQDEAFLAFRTKLIEAAERKDDKYIISVLDPKIELSFGGQSGIADFKKMWKIGQKDSPFWEEFLAVIKNGGSFTGDGMAKLDHFAAPYTFSAWPEDVDGFEYLAVFGSNVNLRESPSAEANVVDRLSYNMVKPEGEWLGKSRTDGPGQWRKVITMGGKSGYIHSDYLRSHIDYRAGFAKKRGVWKMAYFISGD